MSLAELLSDTKGLSPLSGSTDTKLRFVSERVLTSATPIAAGGAAALVGVVGSHVNIEVSVPGTSTYTDVIPTGILRASASGSSSLGDLEFNLGLLVNDQRNPLEILPRSSDNLIRLNDLNIALNTATMGSLTWGYQPNVFGGFAEKYNVMPGLGTVASAHKPQFKYTTPSYGGLELEVALSQQNRALDGVTIAGAVGVLNSTVSTRLGTEARLAYDLGSLMGSYGNAKIGAEILSQKAVKFGAATGVLSAANVVDASDTLTGMGYFLDADFSGAKVCLNKSKTKGLGPIYQTLGGYATNAADAVSVGRRHYEHLNATVNYTIPMSFPVDLSVNYGKTERKGVTVTGAAELATPMENKRLGLSLCSNVSDALCFSGSYDKIDSKVGTQVAKTDGGSAKVYAFAGHYKF